MKKYMMGLDLGTTAVKAVLFSTEGEYVDKETEHYPLHTPDVHTAEQDPDEILGKAMRAVKTLVERNSCGNSIEFISCSSAMHSLILLDRSGSRLTECITWADRRSEDVAEAWNTEKGVSIYRRTGTPIHPMSPFIKLLYFKEANPGMYSRIGKIVGIKEYVLHHFTGLYEVDKSVASSMGMMNLETSQWDEEVLDILELSPEQLPDIVDTTRVYPSLNRAYDHLGVAEETKIVIGASDGVLANLGVNAIEEGDIAITIGTSGAIRTVIDAPRTDAKMRIFCYHLTNDHYVIGGPVNNGGVVLRWVRDELCQEEVGEAATKGKDPYEVMTQAAKDIQPGSNGLIFHPYLAGERAPLWNAKAVGSFYGMTLSHSRSHMIRAAMEGVVYNLYSVYLALREQMSSVKSIKASGGFARSEMWKQLMSDVFGEQLTVPKSYESSAFGACLLGLYAIGEMDDLSAVSNFVGESDAYTPDEKVYMKYQEIMSVYIEIGRALEPFYDRMDDIR
ncbi:gluconokinase [Salinicoccus cyprini]|uniref:Gluconokinase n=1 Tax=Salinicoccus cyprini TaxID=2493691 RepID=A0A558AS48_9STAP|nr:gluconokinase [Salinicoccus cyprini]TVT27081.1 gluconokinase [Salinicoccus cyprini]